VDDIFTIFACLDENNLIVKLPKYVCSGRDSMPPMRLYDGDLQGIMALIRKMKDTLQEYGDLIAILTSEVKALKVSQTVQSAQPLLAVPPVSQSSAPVSTASLLEFPRLECSTSSRSADFAAGQSTSLNDWSMAAAASSVVCTNKFAVLQSTDEGKQSDANGGPLTVVKKRREKRSRQSSSPVVLPNPSVVDGANQRRRSLLGKSTATGGRDGISAARRIRKR